MAVEYEVESVLNVVDRASPKLERILGLANDVAKAFERLKLLGPRLFSGTNVGRFTTQLGNLDKTMTATAASMERIGKAADGAFMAAATAINRTDGAIVGLRANLTTTIAQMKLLKIPALGPSSPAGGGGSGGHGGGRGGSTFIGGANAFQGGAQGRFHPHFGMPAIGALGAIGYGVYQEAQVEDIANRVMLAANQKILGPDLMATPQAMQLRNTIRQSMADTGMSAQAAGSVALPVVLQMAGMSLQKRLNMLPMFEQFAFLESKMKGVEPGEAAGSLVGLLHMTGSYTPESMKHMASALAFASTVSPEGLPTIERMASYAVPTALTAGIDPAQLLLVLATAQSAGVKNSKAGTWFQDMISTLSPKGGLPAMMTSRGGKMHLRALAQLGMVQNGHIVGMEMLERGDWVGFSKTLSAHLATIPKSQRVGILENAFGKQGGRAAAILGFEGAEGQGFAQRLPVLEQAQHNFLSGGDDLGKVIAKLAAGDPLVQAQKAEKDLENALMDLGKVAMPALTSAIRALDQTLHALVPNLPGGNTDKGAGQIQRAGAAGGLVAGGGLALAAGAGMLPAALAAAAGGYVGLKGANANLAVTKHFWDQGLIFDPFSGLTVPMAKPGEISDWGAVGQWFSGSSSKSKGNAQHHSFWDRFWQNFSLISPAGAAEMPGGIRGITKAVPEGLARANYDPVAKAIADAIQWGPAFGHAGGGAGSVGTFSGHGVSGRSVGNGMVLGGALDNALGTTAGGPLSAATLNAISQSEGTWQNGGIDWNRLGGGRPDANLVGMTVAAATNLGGDLGGLQLNAANLAGAVRAGIVGLGDKMTPETQQKIASWVWNKQGPGAWVGLRNHPNLMRAAIAGGLTGAYGVAGAIMNFGAHGGVGAPGTHLLQISTPDGKKFTVNAAAAPAFRGFVADLEKTGYKIGSIGGYNYRNMTGGRGLSEHAYGLAIDINPLSNAYGSRITDMPRNIHQIAAKWGLIWGGDWKSKPDPMHFQWGGSKPWLSVGAPPSRHADHMATGHAIAHAVKEALSTPDGTLGEIHLDGELLGNLQAKEFARGISRAAASGSARSGVRPDYSGAPAVPPPF